MGVVFIQWDTLESGKLVQSTNNAYIHFDTISVEAKVGGYVSKVRFNDYQAVAQGDTLVELVDEDYRTAVMEAEARMEYAKAALLKLSLEERLQEARLMQTRAILEAAAAKLELAEIEDARASQLVKESALPKSHGDTARTTLRTAQANHTESAAMVEVQQRTLESLTGERAMRQADLKAAEASLAKAQLDLNYTRIIVPTKSTTGSCGVREGELIRPGALIATLVPDAAPYILANYKETQLTNIRPGQLVEIRIDTFPGKILTGKVGTISPATGATFSLLSTDNSSGNFTKVVQRIPVRIEIDEKQDLIKNLRAGMSVTVYINTESVTL